jgi:hypothetical protein
MSALAKLIGVECVDCRERGHHCQAQLWEDRDGAQQGLCLRCADGEPCYRETAEYLVLPERSWLELEDVLVPSITQDDCEFVRRIARNDGVNLKGPRDAAKRKGMRDDLGAMTNEDLADKYQVEMRTVVGLRGRDKFLREERARLPVEQKIKGETVHMAPKASMGAEMLWIAPLGLEPVVQQRDIQEAAQPPARKWTVRQVQNAVCTYYKITLEELLSHDKQHAVALPRHVAIYFSKEKTTANLQQLCRAFDRHHTTILASLKVVRAVLIAGGPAAAELGKINKTLT